MQKMDKKWSKTQEKAPKSKKMRGESDLPQVLVAKVIEMQDLVSRWFVFHSGARISGEERKRQHNNAFSLSPRLIYRGGGRGQPSPSIGVMMRQLEKRLGRANRGTTHVPLLETFWRESQTTTFRPILRRHVADDVMPRQGISGTK